MTVYIYGKRLRFPWGIHVAGNYASQSIDRKDNQSTEKCMTINMYSITWSGGLKKSIIWFVLLLLW